VVVMGVCGGGVVMVVCGGACVVVVRVVRVWWWCGGACVHGWWWCVCDGVCVMRFYLMIVYRFVCVCVAWCWLASGSRFGYASAGLGPS